MKEKKVACEFVFPCYFFFREEKMKKILKWFDTVTCFIQEYILVLTCVIVTALIITGAIMRYIFKTDFYGSEELILFTAFWLYFIGSMSSARDNTHINADMISLFTKKQSAIKVVHVISVCVSLFVAVLALKWGVDWLLWAQKIKGKSPVFKMPNLIAQFPIVLSFFFWVLYLIRDLIKILFNKESK